MGVKVGWQKEREREWKKLAAFSQNTLQGNNSFINTYR
jgi:hypothetical protein